MKILGTLSFFLLGSVIAYRGNATFYGDPTDESKGELNPFNQQQHGACGPPRGSPPKGYKQYYVALNGPQFDAATSNGNTWNNKLCGRCIQVTNPINNQKVDVFLTDSCPSCSSGDVDLSLVAFSDLVGGESRAYNLGILLVEWKFVKCPLEIGTGAGSSAFITNSSVPLPTHLSINALMFIFIVVGYV